MCNANSPSICRTRQVCRKLSECSLPKQCSRNSSAPRHMPTLIIINIYIYIFFVCTHCSGRKKAHKHKLFALVNARMALGQTAGCPRVSRAKKFMCSPRNTGNINFFPLVNQRVVPGLSRLSKSLCVQGLCAFSCPNCAGSHLRGDGKDSGSSSCQRMEGTAAQRTVEKAKKLTLDEVR